MISYKQNYNSINREIIENSLGRENSVIVYDETNSTNIQLKRLAQSGAGSGCVVIANAQTDGRGRMGRSFFSPADNGIYMSYLYKPNLPKEQIVLVTTATSVIVCRAIEKLLNKKPLIKWVNDLYLNEKKVCGILAESAFNSQSQDAEYIIIGIGINCRYSDFPDEIKDIAGSLSEDREEFVREDLIIEIVKGLNDLDKTITGGEFLKEYKKRSMVIGKKIRILGEDTECVAIDIDKGGGLLVELADGSQRTLSSGEISIRMV